MSGPYDRPEDPDEVTLWAGRLRAWPTPPAPPADGDVDDDTAVSARSITGDDTVRVVRDAPADDTVRVVRAAPETRPQPTPEPEPEPGSELEPEPEPRPDSPPAPADDTVRVARDRSAARSADPMSPDDTTSPGRRRGIIAPDPVIEEPEPEPAPEPEREPESETGDTAAGTRRARSRVRPAAPEIPSGDPVPTPREARVPTAGHALYRPRADEAIRVTRNPPPARPADAPDAAETQPRGARLARRRGVALAVTVVVLVAAAAIALFLLMG